MSALTSRARLPRRRRTAFVAAVATLAVVFACLLPQAAAAVTNTQREWFFIPQGAHTRPTVPTDVSRLLERYSGIWLGPPKVKTVYLTFDVASEFGTTARIVRILDNAGIAATFFLTGQYIHDNPAMTRRLVKHGNLVCNHSYTHPNMVRLVTNRAAFSRQLSRTAGAYRTATGERPVRIFRFPYGSYSARALQLAEQLGYASVFWSFAHYDYDENNQPPVSVTRTRLVRAAAPGVVYLLHAGSRSDTNALATVIGTLKDRGYSFGTVDELLP